MVSPIRGLWSLVSSFPHLPLSKSVNPATGVGVTVQGGKFLRTSPPRLSIKGAGNHPSSQWKEPKHSQGSVQKTQHRNEVTIPPPRPPLSIVDNSSVPSFDPVATVEFTPRYLCHLATSEENSSALPGQDRRGALSRREN